MTQILPKVTVLVPSFNHERYVATRIESIMNQSYSNFELIVIDDRSTDGSHEIISELQTRFGFTYLRNAKNSGSPFAAWEQVCQLANGEFIWVCESDDVAEPRFLETAVSKFADFPKAVMFYCSSHVVNEQDEIVGHTDTYFHETWKETRWDKDFVVNGNSELREFQLRGQTLPNMSSAVFAAGAFRKAFTPFLKKFKLTGDWLFVGEIMKHGEIIFCNETLSRFRKHEDTARVRVKSARSQAEYLHTKFSLFQGSGKSFREFGQLMKLDVFRFLYEPARWYEVLLAMFKVSVTRTIGFGLFTIFAVALDPRSIKKFRARLIHAKELENNG